MSGLRQFWQRWQSLILIIGAAVWTVITAGASAYWSVRQFQATSEQFQSRLAFERETRDNARASAEHDRFWQMRWGELEMVGDAGIRNAARLVGEQIRRTEENPHGDRHNLRWAIECMADELRFSLEHAWGLEKGLKRESVLKEYVSKLPDGCSQGRDEPIRPLGMR